MKTVIATKYATSRRSMTPRANGSKWSYAQSCETKPSQLFGTAASFQLRFHSKRTMP